jgi:hypothetical protein
MMFSVFFVSLLALLLVELLGSEELLPVGRGWR